MLNASTKKRSGWRVSNNVAIWHNLVERDEPAKLVCHRNEGSKFYNSSSTCHAPRWGHFSAAQSPKSSFTTPTKGDICPTPSNKTVKWLLVPGGVECDTRTQPPHPWHEMVDPKTKRWAREYNCIISRRAASGLWSLGKLTFYFHQFAASRPRKLDFLVWIWTNYVLTVSVLPAWRSCCMQLRKSHLLAF